MRTSQGEMAELAEGAPLLREYGLTPIEGSNPSLSARKENEMGPLWAHFFFLRGWEDLIRTLRENLTAKDGGNAEGLSAAPAHPCARGISASMHVRTIPALSATAPTTAPALF